MAEPNSPNKQQDPSPDEVSLQDIDRILEEDDPSFTESLSDLSPEEGEADVEIESALDDDSLGEDADESVSFIERYPHLEKLLKPIVKRSEKITSKWREFRANLLYFKNRIVVSWQHSMHFLRTQPKEFAQYLQVQLKAVKAQTRLAVDTFKGWPIQRRMAFVGLSAVVLGAISLLYFNVKGRWLPQIHRPFIGSFVSVADKVYAIDSGADFRSLYEAFPQPEFTVLLEKVVVNLKRTRNHPNPMGAFEFFISVDSHDSAIELKDREKEFVDLISRVTEELTYEALSTPAGQQRLKTSIKSALNEVLTQGWVSEVYLKTIILKR